MTVIKKIGSALTLSLVTSQVAIASEPWVLEQGEANISLVYVTESFEDKWLAEEKSSIDEISQTTTWLMVDYGLTDNLQISLVTGYTESEFDANTNEYSGAADSKIAGKYLLLDEYGDSPLTLSIQGGYIIKGSYDRSSAGNPHSPGDKADGLELSVPVAKTIGLFTAMGELGYRSRSDDVPDEVFYSLGIAVSPIERFSLMLKYNVVDAEDGLDIGGEGFTPDRFHETEEDREILELSGFVNIVNRWSILFGYADVLDGRNTGDSEILYVGVKAGF